RARRLGLPVTKLMASSLELPPHMDLSGLEVDIPPGEPQRFATAQAKHEDEDVGGVQRIVIATGRFQERTSLFDRPPLALPFPGSWEPHLMRDGGFRLMCDTLGFCLVGSCLAGAWRIGLGEKVSVQQGGGGWHLDAYELPVLPVHDDG